MEGEQRQGSGGSWGTGFCHAVFSGNFVTVDLVSAEHELWIYFPCCRGGLFLLFPVAFIVKSTNHIWGMEQGLELGMVTMDSTQVLLMLPRTLALPWITPLSAQLNYLGCPSHSCKLWDVTALASKVSGPGGATWPIKHLPNTQWVYAPGTVLSISFNLNNSLSGEYCYHPILLAPLTGGLRVVCFLISCPNIRVGSIFLSPLLVSPFYPSFILLLEGSFAPNPSLVPHLPTKQFYFLSLA